MLYVSGKQDLFQLTRHIEEIFPRCKLAFLYLPCGEYFGAIVKCEMSKKLPLKFYFFNVCFVSDRPCLILAGNTFTSWVTTIPVWTFGVVRTWSCHSGFGCVEDPWRSCPAQGLDTCSGGILIKLGI